MLGPGGMGVRPPVTGIAHVARFEVGDRFAHPANIRFRRSKNHFKAIPNKVRMGYAAFAGFHAAGVLMLLCGKLADAWGLAWPFVLGATVRLTTFADVKASWGRKTIKES
jgi:hypothetical protein